MSKNMTAKEMLEDLLERVKSGSEAPENVAEYRHLAGEISAWGAKFAEAMRRRDERAGRKRIACENDQVTRKPMNKYLCHTCGKTVMRESSKRWMKSVCEATGKDVRIWRQNAKTLP